MSFIGPDDPRYPEAVRILNVLASRPECEHGLNGACKVCGPSLSYDEALAWQRELSELMGDGDEA